jgi:hypothetical protein
MKKHAKIGSPSSLYRLEKCPGSAAFGKDIKDPPPSEYAKEGTVFHDVMEYCFPYYLNDDLTRAEKRIAAIPDNYEDMPEHVWSTLEEMRAKWKRFCDKHTDPKYHLEFKIKVSPDIYGTADVVFEGINNKTGIIDVIVIDYKYGMGVGVVAEDNLQILAYLIGAINVLDVTLTGLGVAMGFVAQVRVDGGWSDFKVTPDQLHAWKHNIITIVDDAKAIYEGKRPIEGNLHAGSHCRFCKCLSICPEAKTSALLAIQEGLEELPLDEAVRKLTLDEQAALFLKKNFIEDFLEAVAKNLTAAFEAGITHPALKLVKTNGRRKWDDEQEVANELKELGINPFKSTLRGITEVEKELGKNKVKAAHLMIMGEGKLQLVKVDDKRESVEISGLQELPE